MIDMATARQIVCRSAVPLPAGTCPRDEALGLRLCEAVKSDADVPAFAKSRMDGYAIRAQDLQQSSGVFAVQATIYAGAEPIKIGPQQAARIMTGAPLPPSANAVVKREASEPVEASDGQERVRLRGPAQVGQCMLHAGELYRHGDPVLAEGCLIGPAEIALLAELGCSEVPVFRRPVVGVLPTGNELVPASQLPNGRQIRNSNGPMLLALCRQARVDAHDLGIGPDEPGRLQQMVEAALPRHDLLLLSGGVSVGDKDYIPEVLRVCGVVCHFHGIHMKPGKPLWFGSWEASGNRCLVFGLPGNPVSAMVGFLRCVEPALRGLRGNPAGLDTDTIQLPLAHEFVQLEERPTWLPCRLTTLAAEKRPRVELMPWKGSADIRALCDCHGIALIPHPGTFARGLEVEVHAW